ncbi:hypothetical protein [Pseudomonas pseudonitroreducens]|uniref:hypothetical protein n=1 Tax=Pseudomonas pseudonitroreducens TaxID=2892326 RepID=UPI001F3030FD|nr:hypothetical protein [Pseudomonas pseudonitroreducens]
MNFKIVVVSLFIGGALMGCDQVNKAHSPANWLSVPTLPIIQDAIITMAPTFNGQRNSVLSEQICALASGQTSQAQVNEQLRRMNIEPSRLPLDGQDAVGLLVNGNRAGQTVACAAYQATEVLRPVDIREFAKPVAATTKPEGRKRDDKSTEEHDKAAAPEIDAVRFSQTLPLRVARARADADVFSLIAEQLQRTPGLTVQEYRNKARDLFIRLAPTYLERVRLQMPPSNASYQIVQMDGSHLVFSNNVGTRFNYSVDNGLILTQNGLIWYGKGHLLGEAYRLKVAYFPADVSKLLTAKSP